MHPDLSAHLHSAECNELIDQLKSCHDTKPIGRFLGLCNSFDRLVNRCLKQERQQKQALNRQKSIDRQNAYKDRLKQEQ